MGTLELTPGELVANRFEIDRLAGSGGMGTVYRARDRYSGDIVALKMLQDDSAGSSLAERFVREAKLLAEVRHPGIVAHVGHGETPDGRLFLAMEWLEGEDLAERLARGALSTRETLVLADRVAEALAAAHQRGIVHRDLKPSNLFLVDRDVSRTKLLDFGVARRTVGTRAMTRTGAIVGTPEYMAPEQARGLRELTPAADLFSLGCVLYQCLVGAPPFVAEHLAAVLVQILLEEPQPIHDRRIGVPSALVELVDQLLAKDPAKRPADANAVRAALAAIDHRAESAVALAKTVANAQNESFGEREQYLYSIVLASPAIDSDELVAAEHPTTSPTQAGAEPPLAAPERESLVRALQSLGATAEFLATGALVATVAPMASAQDQAVVATRAALLIKERWPAARVALGMGRGTARGRTAVGEVAELAARTLRRGSQASTGGSNSGVFVDALVAKLLEGRFALTPQPGGALIRYEAQEADASRPLLGKPTPCVGRDAELATLQAALASCIEESEARVILFTAAPGVGKSRLRHEFLRRVEERDEPVTLLLGRGDIMSAGTPYGMLRSAFAKLCSLRPGDDLEAQRARLCERVATNVAEAEHERVGVFLAELCAVPFAAEGRPMLRAARQDPKIMHDSMRRALSTFFAAECAASAVLIVLEDLHWGDELTVSVLGDVLRDQASRPLLVVAFARPQVHEVFPDLWPGHAVQEIPLKGLSRKACERLIQQVLGKSVPADVCARAIEQANGNALFLEELIRSIADGDARGQSDTVVAMLQAHIGRLGTGARRAVLAASVLGQTFWQDGVAAIMGHGKGSPEVDEWLAAAVGAELIHSLTASRVDAGKEYGFRHALVRDAAYSLLTPEDLSAGHRLAAEFLTSVGERDAAIIAEHFARCGDALRAAKGYLRAAADRLESGNNSGALQLAARGLASEPPPDLAAQLRGVESNALFLTLQHDRLGEPSAVAIAQAPHGSVGWCYAIVPALRAALAAQDRVRIAEIIARVLATQPEPDARVVFVQSLFLLQAMFVGIDRMQSLEALQHKLEQQVAAATDTDPTLQRYASASLGSTLLNRTPRIWTAVNELRRSLELCSEAGDQRLEFSTRGTLEIGWLELGDAEGVRDRLLGMNPRMQQSEARALLVYVRHTLAMALCASAEPAAWDEARKVMEPFFARGGGSVALGLAHSIEARAARQRGATREAVEHARAATGFLPHRAQYVAQVAAVHVRAASALGEHAEATRVADEGLARVARLENLGFGEVELRLAASEAFRAAGDATRAQRELEATLRQIQLRAEDIADATWRESFLTRNAPCVRARALAAEWGVGAA